MNFAVLKLCFRTTKKYMSSKHLTARPNPAFAEELHSIRSLVYDYKERYDLKE
jgi:hypothetical protein